VPATAFYARYGLDDIQEVQGAIYPAPIAGPIGFDGGWARQWWSGCDYVPAFMTSAKLALFFNPKALLGRRSGLTGKPYALGLQAFELLDASFSWTLRHDHTLYTGTQWILQVERAIFRPGIMLGYQMAFHKHWHWLIEGSYLALSSHQEHGLVRWLHLNHLGAFGLTMGIEYHFGL
jgi:hypothetical protein